MMTIEQVYDVQNTGLAKCIKHSLRKLKKHKYDYISEECIIYDIIYGNQVTCSRCRFNRGSILCYLREYSKVVC